MGYNSYYSSLIIKRVTFLMKVLLVGKQVLSHEAKQTLATTAQNEQYSINRNCIKSKL